MVGWSFMGEGMTSLSALDPNETLTFMAEPDFLWTETQEPMSLQSPKVHHGPQSAAFFKDRQETRAEQSRPDQNRRTRERERE